jgi:hypothetical protein
VPLPGSLAFGTPRDDGGMAIRDVSCIHPSADDTLLMVASWERDNSYGTNTRWDLDGIILQARLKDGAWTYEQIGGKNAYFLAKRDRKSWSVFLQLKQMTASFAS